MIEREHVQKVRTLLRGIVQNLATLDRDSPDDCVEAAALEISLHEPENIRAFKEVLSMLSFTKSGRCFEMEHSLTRR